MATGILKEKQPRSDRSMANTLLGINYKNTAQLIQAIDQGFSFATLERVRRETGLPMKMLADSIGISERTLTRRKKERRLTPTESDRLVSVTRLLSLATDLFSGDRNKAIRWFLAPSPALGNTSPLEMAVTVTGSREVENLIGRLEHGVFS